MASAASVTGTKRPHSPDSASAGARGGGSPLFIPEEDLTRHNFVSSRDDLSDRQLFAWAYRTETKVRFQKLEGRTNPSSTDSSNSSYSATLNSDYLLDVYPINSEKEEAAMNMFAAQEFTLSELGHDLIFYDRKAIDSLIEMREPDGSLEPIHTDNFGEKEYVRKNEKPAMPPNYLYFLMILEAYCGYDLRGFYNSPNPEMPRAAIMGGAVVAALTSWSEVSFKFEELEEILEQGSSGNMNQNELQDEYSTLKEELLCDLNKFFVFKLDERSRPCRYYSDHATSDFALGDVDVFLQASPITREANQTLLRHNLHPEIIMGNILGYVGGIGLVENDLRKMSEAVLSRLDDTFNEDGAFVPVLAKNGLTFMLGLFRQEEWDDKMMFPRQTQLISLNPSADLVGALMDFDLSVAACAFDGTTVRITPRAALSLVRKVVVVTPFCFEEKRNRKRILKYAKRGFEPFILDPNCLHADMCKHWNPASIVREKPEEVVQQEIHQRGAYMARELRDEEEYDSIIQSQLAGGATRYDMTSEGVCCCCDAGSHGGCYSLALFEKTDGDALEYFSKKFSFSEAQKNELASIPKHLQTACKSCRRDYGLHLFFEGEAPVDIESVQDILRGEKSLCWSRGTYSGFFRPSFYSGGAFDNRRVMYAARVWYELCNIVQSQSLAEKARYELRHGTDEGYRQRFLYLRKDDLSLNDSGANLQSLFGQLETLELPGSGRAPVGLNPERFIAKCKSPKQGGRQCGAWLHGCEYGTECCERCANSKPAAV